jgi:hypothetical protein
VNAILDAAHIDNIGIVKPGLDHTTGVGHESRLNDPGGPHAREHILAPADQPMPSDPGTDTAHDVILQVEGPAGTFSGYGFSGVPAARPSVIALYASGTNDSITLVGELADELRTVLLESSPCVIESAVGGADPAALADGDHPERRKVLVLVAAASEPFVDNAWYANWESDPRDACVMTVAPQLMPPKGFTDLLPSAIRRDDGHLLKRVNAAVWTEKVTEVVPAILARADVTSGSARVFISYRRHETAAVALPLFDRLTREGFDVFLDQFSIPPGYDFQRRLGQELQDKSMVVLLESKYAGDSKWTQHEIDFAKRHRLGLLSIRMPDVDGRAALVGDHASYPLKHDASDATDFAGKVEEVERSGTDNTLINRWPALTDGALGCVVAEIKRAHAAALFLRRHRLRADLTTACEGAKLKVSGNAAGPLWVKGDRDEHLVWLTTRPAGVEEFQAVFKAHDSWATRTGGSRGVIVGPQAALEPDRLAHLKWLQRVTSCVPLDEGRLDDVVERLRSGTWT